MQVRCEHFGACGGCSWQDVDYNEQLRRKEYSVHRALNGLGDAEFFPIIPSPETWFYRNKMEFTFSGKEGDVKIGMHERGRFDRIVDINKCFLLSEYSNGIIEFFRDFANKKRMRVYHPKTHKGLLRYLVIREGKNTEEVLVNLITTRDDFEYRDELVETVHNNFSRVKAFFWGINTRIADTAIAEELNLLYGKPYLKEKISSLNLLVSPVAFFQPNTKATEKLYDIIEDFAGLSGDEIVLDLYCGVGGIGIYLGKRAGKIYGIELSAEAIMDARRNADLNSVDNTTFYKGDVKELLRQVSNSEFDGRISLVIVDPPRSGIPRKVLRRICDVKSKKIIYISCNPRVLAGDMSYLVTEGGYRIIRVQPLDMFPHTPHVETVLLLEKKL